MGYSPTIYMANPYNRYNLGLFNSGTYTPAINDLTNVTNSNIATVTTVSDHNYVINQQVQFFIPSQWGMRQLNQLKGYVLTIPTSNEFTVNINTSQFDAFITPTPPTYIVIDPAQVMGIGETNYGQSSPGGIPILPITIPGAYENQPP
jgi:hypothetical protein